MTQKELLYIEDAVGHEGNIIKILEDTINNLEDNKLVTFLKNELKRHTAMHEKLMYVLEDKANE